MTASREYKYIGDTLYLKCTQCGERSTIDNFMKNKNKKFGVVSRCKKCNKSKRAKFYWNHRDEQLAANKIYCKENREKLSLKAREYGRKNKEKLRDRVKNWREDHKDIVQERAKIHNRRMSEIAGFSRKYFHNKATEYVKRNGLRPSKCSICGHEGNIHMHHPSYECFDKRKEVVFCCHECHCKIHIGEIKCPNPVNLLNLIN